MHRRSLERPGRRNSAVHPRRAEGAEESSSPESPSSNVVISNHSAAAPCRTPYLSIRSEAPMSEFLFLYRNSPAAREAAMGTPEQRQKSMQRDGVDARPRRQRAPEERRPTARPLRK